MTAELRRKQVEEARKIVTIIASKEDEIRKMGFASSFLEAIESSILSLLSDAECKGAWAVCRAVEADRAMSREGSHAYEMLQGAVDAARQVAESFGPDPEGEGK